jgi:hypothetical protein
VRREFFALAALIALAIAGCQNASPPATEASASAPPPRGILVTGGNTGTVIFLQSDDAAHPTILCSPGTDVCPMCKAAAIKYFQTGVLEPTCSRTGTTRTLLVPATPTNGHQ